MLPEKRVLTDDEIETYGHGDPKFAMSRLGLNPSDVVFEGEEPSDNTVENGANFAEILNGISKQSAIDLYATIDYFELAEQRRKISSMQADEFDQAAIDSFATAMGAYRMLASGCPQDTVDQLVRDNLIEFRCEYLGEANKHKLTELTDYLLRILTKK